MDWKQLAHDFEHLSADGDANVEWVFTCPRGVRRHWRLADAQSNISPDELWARFERAGFGLQPELLPPWLFPLKLIALQPAAWRWLAALRHTGINVVGFQPNQLRTNSGMIYCVVSASGRLCRRLAEIESGLATVSTASRV